MWFRARAEAEFFGASSFGSLSALPLYCRFGRVFADFCVFFEIFCALLWISAYFLKITAYFCTLFYIFLRFCVKPAAGIRQKAQGISGGFGRWPRLFYGRFLSADFRIFADFGFGDLLTFSDYWVYWFLPPRKMRTPRVKEF